MWDGTQFATDPTSMQSGPDNSLAERKAAMSIADILNAQPLCEQIAQFLLENEHALDTTRGIAAWWVGSDEIAVQAALDQLIACGVIALYPFTSGMLYGLTRDQEIRGWLRIWFGAKTQQGGLQPATSKMPLLPDYS